VYAARARLLELVSQVFRGTMDSRPVRGAYVWLSCVCAVVARVNSGSRAQKNQAETQAPRLAPSTDTRGNLHPLFPHTC